MRHQSRKLRDSEWRSLHPCFGEYRALAGGFGPNTCGSSTDYNRKVTVQLRFSFLRSAMSAVALTCRIGKNELFTKLNVHGGGSFASKDSKGD